MTTLREQLARKRAHTATLVFPLGDDGQKAKAAVAQAEAQLTLVHRVSLDGDERSKAVTNAERDLSQARKAYDKVSLTIQIRGLDEEERDALMSAHPATDEQIEKWKSDGGKDEDKPTLDRASFLPAALAMSVLDSDLTEAEWAAELTSGRWAAGEKLQLFRGVLEATHASPADGLGKGFGTIR